MRVGQVDVATTNAAAMDADEELAGRRHGNIQLFDLQGRPDTFEHCCPHLHGSLRGIAFLHGAVFKCDHQMSDGASVCTLSSKKYTTCYHY